MKIAGTQKVGPNWCMHEIERPQMKPLQVKLTALPIGFSDLMEADLPMPQPPIDLEHNPDGSWKQDASGRAIRRQNTEDPGYRRRLEEMHTLRVYYQVVQALAGDPSVEFGAQRKDYPNVADWCRAIGQEMKDFGLSDAELYAMLLEVQKLNSGHVERVHKAADGFLSIAPAAGMDGASQTAR